MSFNPYEPPTAIAENRDTSPRVRAQAVLHLRLVGVILLLPAIYNYLAFDAGTISHWLWPWMVGWRTMSLLGFVLVGVLVWHGGLPALERIGQGIRQMASPTVDERAWNEPLYAAVHRAVYLAIPGAILWAIWVFGFYVWRADFITISYAVGIPAHALGACFYLPLFYQWYRLRR